MKNKVCPTLSDRKWSCHTLKAIPTLSNREWSCHTLKGIPLLSNRERSCHTLKGVPLLSNRVISSHLKQVKGNTNTVKDHWCDRCCQIVIDHVEWSGHIWVSVLSFKDPCQCVCIHVSLSLCLCWCAYLSLFLSLLMCLSLSHSIFLSLSPLSRSVLSCYQTLRSGQCAMYCILFTHWLLSSQRSENWWDVN